MRQPALPRTPSTRLRPRRVLRQRLAFLFLWMAAAAAVSALIAVVAFVGVRAVRVLNIDLLLTSPAGGLSGEGGISTTIVTTLYLVALTTGLATPLGVGAAIYLTEYAGQADGRRKPALLLLSVARFGVETLAGVPSIVFGLFGYALFVSALHFGFSLLSASLAGACLILPVIIRATEEALRAVPQAYREGSLALGATQWQTVSGVVLPSALPGIVTSVILSIGRVVGETAVFYVTLGGSSDLPRSLLSPGRTLALHLYSLAMDTRAFDKAMGTGAVLVLIIILLNAAISLLSRHMLRIRG